VDIVDQAAWLIGRLPRGIDWEELIDSRTTGAVDRSQISVAFRVAGEGHWNNLGDVLGNIGLPQAGFSGPEGSDGTATSLPDH
jgi:hypothetical protein